MTEKPTASVSEDRSIKETAFSPVGQNNCFLCSKEIGESDPRQFYSPPQNPSAIMLAHTGCLNKFKANGEVWPEEEKPEPQVQDLGDVGRVRHGLAAFSFSPYHLTLTCQKTITEKGLKAVIPDLIAALHAAEQTL